jgi:hypothetical protein
MRSAPISALLELEKVGSASSGAALDAVLSSAHLVLTEFGASKLQVTDRFL